MTGAHNQVLALIDADVIVDRIAAGEYQSHIAVELSIPPQRLHEVISKHPRYRSALETRNLAKLDSSQDRIDSEGADLARAREAFKAAAWRAERECPSVWGQKAQVTVNQGLTLDGALDQIAGAVLDRMKVVSEQSTGSDGQIEGEIKE